MVCGKSQGRLKSLSSLWRNLWKHCGMLWLLNNGNFKGSFPLQSCFPIMHLDTPATCSVYTGRFKYFLECVYMYMYMYMYSPEKSGGHPHSTETLQLEQKSPFALCFIAKKSEWVIATIIYLLGNFKSILLTHRVYFPISNTYIYAAIGPNLPSQSHNSVCFF